MYSLVSCISIGSSTLLSSPKKSIAETTPSFEEARYELSQQRSQPQSRKNNSTQLGASVSRGIVAKIGR
jgi:hypothetical protein